jgi:hypothetical protein
MDVIVRRVNTLSVANGNPKETYGDSISVKCALTATQSKRKLPLLLYRVSEFSLGHSIGHSKQRKVYMYMCLIPNGVRDRAILLYSSSDLAPNVVLTSRM